jgi:hypothetical protein
LCAASVSAFAGITDLGKHAPIELLQGSAIGAGTMIDDKFSFSLTDPSSVMAVAVANDGANGVFDLQNGVVNLYMVGNSQAIGSFSFDSMAVSHSWGALAVGDYYYEVTAQVVSTAAAGSYQLSSTLTPVPEPETYAMLLAGLTVLGGVASRRRKL